MIIYITSKKSKVKIPVGEIDFNRKTALFYITERRFFKEANCIGIDENVFMRKDMSLVDFLIFKFWDGRKVKLTKSEFVANCWRYPRGDEPHYKANKSVFEPKLMLGMDTIDKIIMERRPETEEDQYKRLLAEGVFN